eukprot:scaffold110661_cov23-Prasinocladus_malaysianus.AAC.1
MTDVIGHNVEYGVQSLLQDAVQFRNGPVDLPASAEPTFTTEWSITTGIRFVDEPTAGSAPKWVVGQQLTRGGSNVVCWALYALVRHLPRFRNGSFHRRMAFVAMTSSPGPR